MDTALRKGRFFVRKPIRVYNKIMKKLRKVADGIIQAGSAETKAGALGYVPVHAGKVLAGNTEDDAAYIVKTVLETGGKSSGPAALFFDCESPENSDEKTAQAANRDLAHTPAFVFPVRSGQICALYFPLSPLTPFRVNKSRTDLHEVRALYERAFPADERMPFRSLLKYLDNDRVMTVYASCGELIGFTYTFRHEDMIYLGYFAIEEDCRSYGCGSEVLRQLIQDNPGMRIIIDIEKEDPGNQETVTRKNFYRRAGFAETEVAYRFYGVDYELMVYGGHASEEDWDHLAKAHWGGMIKMPVYYEKTEDSL